MQEEYANRAKQLIGELNSRLIERNELSRLVVLVIMSHTHMFLLGERGVAKSMTVEMTNNVIEGSKFWQLQVGEGTTQEDLLGAREADKEGTVQYTSKKSLINANIVIIDEMFKAPYRTLNVLLEILVDNAYTSGDGIKKSLDIVSIFGTSNEFPTSTFMLPFMDRFTFIFKVERIKSPENRRKFYAKLYDTSKITKTYFNMDDLFKIKDEISKISIPEEIIILFEKITSSLVKQNVKTSDRKYENILLKVIRTMAYLNNRENVDISDLFILLHTSWHDYTEQVKVKRVVFEQIFGSAEEIESVLISVKKRIDEIDAFKNNVLFDYINYRQDISGINKEKTFEYIKNNTDGAWREYNKMNEVLTGLRNQYLFCLEVEEKIENNIFLINYKQTSFSKETHSYIEDLLGTIEKKNKELFDWYKENETLYNYQTNFLQKNMS